MDPRFYGAEPRGDAAKAGDAREGVSHFVTITYRSHIQGKHEYPVWERRTWEGGNPVTIFTLDRYGRPGMPTFNIKKVRRMLKGGRAEIYRHEPFTIRLLYAESLDTQPVELCMDTGERHIGISVKSEKHEFVHAQYDTLPDEKQRHDDRRGYRRQRRSRKRYRKPRFDNRRKPEGWLAPSVRNRKDLHVSLVLMYRKVCPLTSVTMEMGSFDTQALEAIEAGRPLPEGKDYQQGPRYRLNTLRDAVFYRDGHKCLLCGNTEGPFAVHHIGYWKGDHTDRMANLATLCTDKCHIPQNHKKGGALFGWQPKIHPMAGAAFMNSVRKVIANEIKEKTGLPVSKTWGGATKTARKALCIEKSHAGDAFAMGGFHPKHRHKEVVFAKRRRNNRVLSRFYDARYTDTRDGKIKSGQELSCGRTDRSEPRHSDKDLRRFRGHKVRKGSVSTRRMRYAIRPGSVVRYDRKNIPVRGVHCGGTRVVLRNGKSVSVKKVATVRYTGAWERVS